MGIHRFMRAAATGAIAAALAGTLPVPFVLMVVAAPTK
ncbi:MAG: hypothetical protein QOJ75_1900 [Chloroflexota bacterium]|nr:hypothetical protein [Chloroflexota bacterium]